MPPSDASRDDRSSGRVYTDPAIARFLVSWAVDPGASVLEPAVGRGVFADPVIDRGARLFAVDTDPDAVAATRRRVNGNGEVHEGSFFDLDPAAFDGFDAVVGNPPFVRHEAIEDLETCRRHLAAIDGDAVMSRRSDLSLYFVTHASRFLRDGGRIAFVLPQKWLHVDYGTGFQRLLASRFVVHAIVGFDDRAFPEALVGTVLLLAERRDDGSGPLSLVQVTEQGSPASVQATISDAVVGDRLVTRTHRATVADQSVLGGERSALGRSLTVSPVVASVLESERLCPLSALASVRYGHKTGANEWFFIEDGPRPDEAFLRPAIRGLRDIESVVLDEADASTDVLDLHGYEPDVTHADELVESLRGDGFERTARYVERAVEAGYPDRSTLRARRRWFDLGALTTPPIVHPKFFDRRVFVAWNRGRLVPSNAIDCVVPDDGVDVEVLLGVLNSTLHRVVLECWGRVEGGGALQVMTYELASTPVLDVTTLTTGEASRIAAGWRAFLDGDRGPLDAAVLDAIDVDVDPGTLRAIHEDLIERRVSGGKRARVPFAAGEETG